MTLITILLSLIALLLLGLMFAIALRLWRAREDERPLRSFAATIRAAHARMSVRDPYSVPRILATGAPAAIDALSRGWRLTPVGETAWFGRIWNDAEGLLIAEPHDMLAAPATDRRLGAWRRLLRALLRNRAGRPLDAIVWVIAADTLVTEDGAPREMSAAALESSRKLVALQRQFGLMLPLYIVISDCDALPGFNDLAEGLQGATSRTTLGWASPYAPRRVYEDAWLDEAFASIQAALTEAVVELGTLNGGVSDALFLLPQRLDQLRVPLRERVDLALRGAADGTAPLLRGVYCVGQTPERLPAEDPITGTTLRAGAPTFAGRLWHDVLLSGQGLAIPMPRALALRTRWHRVATVCAAVVAVCWCAGMGLAWWHLRDDARVLKGAYDSLTIARATYRQSDRGEAAVTGALESVRDALVKVPRWQLSSPFMPLSYVFLNGRLADGQEHILRGLVFEPLHDRLAARLTQPSCGFSQAAQTDAKQRVSIRPPDLPAFVAGTQLVNDTAQTERWIAQYNELVQIGSGDLAMLAELMRETSGVQLTLEHVDGRVQFDEVLRATTLDGAMFPLTGARAAGARQRVSLCFERSFGTWFDEVYADSTLTANAAQVQAVLTQLRAPGAAPTDATLSTLADGIDALSAQVDLADHGWAGAGGKELVPGLTATFDTAQRLKLIGMVPVQAVLAREQEAQAAFAARWLNNGDLPGVLGTAPAGGLQLSADLPPLREAVRALLAQPFSGGDGNVDTVIRSVDAGTVQRALGVLPAYRQYVAGPLDQAPDAYRAALLAAAGNDAVTSMLAALSTPAQPTAQQGTSSVPDTATQFDALHKSALDLIAAFDSLGRDDLAASVALRVSDAALVVLRTADAQLQTLAPFRPMRGDFSGWDGRPGGSLRAFGAASPQALQAYLAAQAAAITELADGPAGALDWLSVQKPPLNPADASLVSRWKALSADLTQYRAKSPASAMIAVQTIIADQLDKLDLGNCSASLEQVSVPSAGDIVSSAGARLVSSAREQCVRLQMGTGMQAYEQIRSFFGRYLAGRFPFAADPAAPGADLRQTAAFVALLDNQLPQAQTGLAAAAIAGRGQADGADAFIAQLVRAKPWLDTLFVRGTDGMLQGFELSVDWRVDRADEVGADQVIEWKLASGSDTLTYPASGETAARWRPGQAVALSLRWAKDAPWQPMFDAAQPTLVGEHGVATWSTSDTWALLRLVRLHLMPEDASLTSTSLPPRLLFTVPVRDRSGAIQTARMFMRVGFGSAKTAQAIPDLPFAAPGFEGRGTTTKVTYPATTNNNGQADRG
ncbi:type VI secretion system protein [Paraburkholderia acidicola]|uniref:Type VI secretion system protein n=1 Tax=Paraburkholderia acidicola TaxID=1912599 RepID=A0ABV1LW19_9BURK